VKRKMTRKIRWNNLALVAGVSIFDIACGMYNRIVNNSGMVKSVSDWYVVFTNTLSHPITSGVWKTTQVSLATTTESGYTLTSVVLIVITAVLIMGVLFTLVGSRAA